MNHPSPNLHRTSAALLLTSLLAACGGGGSTPASNAAGTNITSGVASKGPLNGANICAYAITASALQGAPIGTCTKTDTTGNYSVNLGPYTGPVLFTAEGGSYIDEATGNNTPLSLALHSLVANATCPGQVISHSPIGCDVADFCSKALGGKFPSLECNRSLL
jgi:hypothetical protein